MTPPLETARLLLRPLELGDADQVELLFPQWEIVRLLANHVPWPYPRGTAHRFYKETALPEVERGNAWYWTLRLKTKPGQVIGSISLNCNETDNRGFWIAPQYQRRGLMTEACDAVTDYWFNVLKFPLLRAPKAVANVASRRISEKQGMRVVATMERDYVSGRLPAELWEITREEWNARKSAESG
ncbi:MAG TPA: GNAT family N-acetyltransferase [Candidatus Angelobacter sp.]|nr:GNAT family N-acetyltransferase [Candidatus Angelobacter sp.]